MNVCGISGKNNCIFRTIKKVVVQYTMRAILHISVRLQKTKHKNKTTQGKTKKVEEICFFPRKPKEF